MMAFFYSSRVRQLCFWPNIYLHCTKIVETPACYVKAKGTKDFPPNSEAAKDDSTKQFLVSTTLHLSTMRRKGQIIIEKKVYLSCIIQ